MGTPFGKGTIAAKQRLMGSTVVLQFRADDSQALSQAG
ncbi:Unknown protein sequence [Pseudomonas syringae pv. maculicola]|nr:Unknown protein sequence [Pseudomonas syringae pv. maculicola]